jgi:predicted membrane-bound spermidine synthase
MALPWPDAPIMVSFITLTAGSVRPSPFSGAFSVPFVFLPAVAVETVKIVRIDILIAFGKDQVDILILGMGSGTYATQCRRYFDNVELEGVEIDQKITDLAEEYFELPEDIPVTTYDGRAYLNSLKAMQGRDTDLTTKYDVIMVDAYQDITIPFQMSSVEFFTLVRDCLKPGGVMVVNMNMHSDKKGSINHCLSDTISEVFKNVYSVPVTGSTNRELFASDDDDMLKRFYQNTQTLSDEPLKEHMQSVQQDLERYESGGNILTDDKAPVELLGMQVIDDLISEQLEHYKKVFEEEGLDGLLNE